MSDLVIICEGQTEQLFCNRILKPHLAAHGVTISNPLIAHSGGGIVGWNHLRPDILNHHAANNAQIITTFIDYYGILPRHNFPDWAAAQLEPDRPTRMTMLEMAMHVDLPGPVAAQFIPYIQLHEFEALVLVDDTAFATRFTPGRYNAPALAALCTNPPETINDGLLTAPSKRIEALVPRYDKKVDGAAIAAVTGLAAIRARCPRFDHWVTTLENL